MGVISPGPRRVHLGCRLQDGADVQRQHHGMERQGYLRSRLTQNAGRNRRVYRATSSGRKALVIGRKRVQELFGEMFEHD